MEITFDDRTIIDGKLQVHVKFGDLVGERYCCADVSVWVPEKDSWEETKNLAMVEAKAFLKRLLPMITD